MRIERSGAIEFCDYDRVARPVKLRDDNTTDLSRVPLRPANRNDLDIRLCGQTHPRFWGVCYRRVEKLGHLLLILRRPIRKTHPNEAKSDGRNFQVTLPKSSLLHIQSSPLPLDLLVQSFAACLDLAKRARQTPDDCNCRLSR
jgi:hypothetical protein